MSLEVERGQACVERRVAELVVEEEGKRRAF